MSGRRPRRSVRHPYPSEARGTAFPTNVRPPLPPATLVLRAVMVAVLGAVMVAFVAIVHATTAFKALQ
jgi:hypothetical protein